MPVTYKKIASVTVGSGGAASIDFTSIPSTYTDLIILVSIRGSASADYRDLFLKFNGSSTGYSNRTLYGSGSSAASGSPFTDKAYVGYPNNATSTSSTFTNGQIYIPNYAGSTNKSLSVDIVTENNATSSFAHLMTSLWSNTNAITSIALTMDSSNFVQYSTAVLYGISKS
jgi:hypothetical protein